MHKYKTILLALIAGSTLLFLSGCGGSGYSSAGYSSRHYDYWGPYRSYRPSYHYNYRYSRDYYKHKNKQDRKHGAVGRPKHRPPDGARRPRPENRVRSRPARRR